MSWLVLRLSLWSLSWLAQTGPKRLLMALSSLAKSETAPAGGRCSMFDESDWLTCGRSRALVVGRVVVNLDRTVADAHGGGVDRGLSFGGDQRHVDVVHGFVF